MRRPSILAILALNSVVCSFPAAESAMQVEEPAQIGISPINPVMEGTWRDGNYAPSLSPAEKAALEMRRKQVLKLAALIRQKREALQDAAPGEKAIGAKDLKDLLLKQTDADEVSKENPGKPESRLEQQLDKTLDKLEKAQAQARKQAEKVEKKVQKELEKQKREKTKAK